MRAKEQIKQSRHVCKFGDIMGKLQNYDDWNTKLEKKIGKFFWKNQFLPTLLASW